MPPAVARNPVRVVALLQSVWLHNGLAALATPVVTVVCAVAAVTSSEVAAAIMIILFIGPPKPLKCDVA